MDALLFSKKIRRVSFISFVKIALIGTVLALHWLCFYGSIKYANVSIALTCFSTTGLLSAIIEPLFFNRRINMFELLLGVFALAGISLIYITNLSYSIGIYVGLLAAVLSVLVSVMNKKFTTGYEPETITLYQLTGGFLGLSLLMPLYNFLFPSTYKIPQHFDWVWLIILSWCCTILTFMLYIKALKKLSAFTVNLTLTLEPVYGIILAFAVYHENKALNKYFFPGFSLIFMAVCSQMVRLIHQNKKLF